jgi:hypothetical protein
MRCACTGLTEDRPPNGRYSHWDQLALSAEGLTSHTRETPSVTDRPTAPKGAGIPALLIEESFTPSRVEFCTAGMPAARQER